ncbi:hypothetical protein BRADI_2g04707v3 [Brachypodium distachyon]|uniref:Uncharacterized protein n=1 Tax=Brachypodium distachyon TaxID=15368 RepID=A0A2K2D708_BRADI|nr:hypothetical protein BRADI_2g04707v3 [Brachypodium distachyon]
MVNNRRRGSGQPARSATAGREEREETRSCRPKVEERGRGAGTGESGSGGGGGPRHRDGWSPGVGATERSGGAVMGRARGHAGGTREAGERNGGVGPGRGRPGVGAEAGRATGTGEPGGGGDGGHAGGGGSGQRPRRRDGGGRGVGGAAMPGGGCIERATRMRDWERETGVVAFDVFTANGNRVVSIISYAYQYEARANLIGGKSLAGFSSAPAVGSPPPDAAASRGLSSPDAAARRRISSPRRCRPLPDLLPRPRSPASGAWGLLRRPPLFG